MPTVDPNFRDAAVVVLLRDVDRDVHVAIGRRARTLPFMGGFDVFPGGSFDPNLDGWGPDRLTQTACRELYEEVGVVVDAACLRPFGAWHTPPYGTVRYRGVYFACELPDGATVDWGRSAEFEAGAWYRPTDALQEHRRGRLNLTFPVIKTLQALTESTDLDAAARLLATMSAQHAERGSGELAPFVQVLPVASPTLPPFTHTNSYLVGGRRFVVVDPGAHETVEVERLFAEIDRRAAEGDHLEGIWLTHHHRDHHGAAGAVRARYRVPVLAHPSTPGWIGAGTPIDAYFADGEVLELEGEPGQRVVWVAIHSPGHAVDHVVFHAPAMQLLVAGDLLIGEGSVFVGGPGADLADYYESLDRVERLSPGRTFAAHGPPLGDGVLAIGRIRNHRRAREAQIVAALGEPTDVETLVRKVYGPEHVGSVVATLALQTQLSYLERRGVIGFEPGAGERRYQRAELA